MNYSDVANMLGEGDDTSVASNVGGTDFQSLVAQKADEYGVPRAIALSLANHESGFNPDARSPAGAIGIMQLMPKTAQDLGVDPTDPIQNIDGGMRYLSDNIKRFGLEGGVAAYQAGPGAVARNGGLPVDASDGLSTNKDYVSTVMSGASKFGGFEPSKAAASGGLSYSDMLQGYDGGTAQQDDKRNSIISKAITDTQNDMSPADTFAYHFSKGVADTAGILGTLTGFDELKKWGKDKSEELQSELMKDPETRDSMQAYADAKGFWGTISALKDHPDLMAGTVAEMAAPFLATLPLTMVGGEVGLGLMGTKIGATIGRVAGLSAEQSAALGAQVGATIGSSASMGAEGGATAYNNIEDTLVKGGMDPAQAKQEAKSGALQVGIITSLLSSVGAGRAAAKIVTGGMAGVRQSLGSAALNTAEAGASGGAMMAAQAGIEANKARMVDPNAQADFGKSFAEGAIPGVMLGAAGEGRTALHNFGKEAPVVAPAEPPAEVPHAPADVIKDVNPDEITARMANAPDVDSAISVFMDSMKDSTVKASAGVTIDSMARADAIRTMGDTDVVRNMLGQLDPVSRQEALQHLNNATSADPRILPATKAASADHVYGLLEQTGGIEEAQRQIAARNLEGTMEEKASIADANTFMQKPEWQQFSANQPENVRAAIDTTARLVNDASQPESVRAESAKRLMDFANRAGVGKEEPAPKPDIEEKVAAAAQQLESNRKELQSLSSSQAWRDHVASLPPEERAAIVEKMSVVANPSISDSYRNAVSAELLHSAEAAGVRAKPAQEAPASGSPPRRITTPEEASSMLATAKLPEGAGTVTLTDPTRFTRSNLANVGGVTGGQARVLQLFGRALGRDVMFFEQNGHTKNIDGFSLPENPNAIFLNRNQSGSASLHAVFGHEFLHTMPDDIKGQFIDAASKVLDPTRAEELRKYINQPDLNAKATMEEIGADLFGNGFNKPELIGKALDQMPVSVATKVLQHVRNFISSMVQRLRGIRDFDTSKFVTDAEAIDTAWVSAFRGYLSRENSGKGMIDGRNTSDLSMEELSTLMGSKDHPHQEKAEAEVARRSTYPDYAAVDKLSEAAGTKSSGYVAPAVPSAGGKKIEAPVQDRLKAQLDARKKRDRGELLTANELEAANAPDVQKKPNAKIAEPDRRFATQSEANYFKRKNRLDSLVAVRDGSGFVLRRSTADNLAATEKLKEAAGKKSSGYVAPDVPTKPEPKPITLDTKFSLARTPERVNPDEMSTVVPTAKGAAFDHVKEFRVIDLAAMKADPKSFDKNIARVVSYPNYKPTKSANTPEKQAEAFINEVKRNILFLHDQMPKELRERAKLWYDGARNIVDRWQGAYGLKDSQLAGAIAVLSPQKDWFMNVNLAQRVLDTMHAKQDFEWSGAMDRVTSRIYAGGDGAKIVDAIRGKKLSELSDRFEKAAWIRAYDEAHNARSYSILSPEGKEVATAMNGSGNEATAAWGSLREISKAVSIIEDPSVQNISDMLGMAHKVRNFYNNILTPNSPNGHVTIDTHAVAAGLLRPLAGGSVEVAQNFGSGGAAKSAKTGIMGTYGLYAEAYRRAAAERGILPREMQSITWEGVRGLFTKTFKRFNAADANIDGLWEAYRKGKASYEATRDKVLELAGGIDRPSWDGPGRVVDAEEGNPADSGQLPEGGVPERSAEPVAGRDTGGAGSSAAAVASVERPRVLFEVAPDPNNKELTDRWNALPSSVKFDVSQKVADKMIPQMLRAVGAKGEMKPQLGGYLGETNPSFSIAMSDRSSPAQIERAAKVAGYMLSQDSMMVVSPKKIEGADPVGVITINLPKDSSPEFVSDIYKKLYEIENGVLQGHTTVDGKMAIIDFSGRTKELGELVDQKLEGKYPVDTDSAYASFIDKKEYGYGSDTSSTGEAATPGSPLRDTANRLRTEASAALESELGSAGLSADRGDGRPGVDGEDTGASGQSDRGRVSEEGYGTPREDSVRVAGTHFSKQPREVLDSSKYGTGMKGAEARRIDNSFDDRLRNRTYFYVDEGTGVKPESGVGASRHDVVLNNLYDMRADPLKLNNGDINKFESAVLDNGFDGYYVKKAFGNQGAAVLLGEHKVPVSKAAQLSVPRNQPPQTFQVDEPGKMDDFIYTMQDKHIDTKRVVQAINDQVGKIDEKWNPYMKESLYHGRTAEQTKDFLRYEMRPLLQTMTASGIKLADLNEYLHMRHAEERNLQVESINPGMKDGSGVSTQDARAYMKSLPADKAGKLASLAKRVDAITKQTRDILVASGLENADTIRNWEATYQNYVPLMRDGVGTEKLGIGSGFSVRGNASKRAMGSDKPVADILAHVAMMRERTIIRAEKNRVSQALYGLAVQNPNTEYWLPVSSAKDIKAQQDMLVKMGLDPADVKSLIDEPTQRYVNPSTGLVESRINPALRGAENVVTMRVDGKDHFLFFNENNDRAARMARSLKNLDADQMGRVLSTAGMVTRYIAAINTQYNPFFGVLNIMRDTGEAALNLTTTPIAGRQREVVSNIPAAVRGVYLALRDERAGKPVHSAWGQLFKEFADAGGKTGYKDMFHNSEERARALQSEIEELSSGKAKQVKRAVLGLLDDFNEALENGTRLAAYKAARDHGMSIEAAASMAKDLTVNFNRKGKIAPQAGALFAFFNASAQGTARLVETMKGPAGKKILAGGLVLGALQAIMMGAAGIDKDVPEFVKQNNIIIPTGGKSYVSIPIPLGFRIIPGISRMMTEFVMNGFKDPTGTLANAIGLAADSFNPIGNAGLSVQTIAPTFADPLVALAENRDWTGKPIAKKDFNSLSPTPGSSRYYDTASSIGKLVSKAINGLTGGSEFRPGMLSPTPDQIDFLIGQVTGGVGREALKAQQTASAAISGEEVPTSKIPLVGRFYGNASDQSGMASKFYDNIVRLNELQAEVKGRMKSKQDYRGFINDNPEYRLAAMADRSEREVASLRKMKRKLVESGGNSARVAAIDQRINAVMARLNDKVESMTH